MKENAVGIEELSQMFGISRTQVIILCRTKGSPAFKAGDSRRAPWLCFPSEFKRWRTQQAEKWKG